MLETISSAMYVGNWQKTGTPGMQHCSPFVATSK